MTHARLLHDMAQGELAYWQAFTERENERYDAARHKAEHEAKVAAKMRKAGF